jgi:hypothetical protein
MKLMSLVKGLVLAAMLACVAQAEQRVIWVESSYQWGTLTHGMAQLDTLLKAGWHITQTSVAYRQGYSQYLTVFVLESPTKEIK